MELSETLGYLASGLVLATFTMRTMIPLRFLGIASNVAFIAYGYAAGILPVLILHAILLPLNIYRLVEMFRLIREVENAGRRRRPPALADAVHDVRLHGGRHDPVFARATRPTTCIC